MVKYIVLLLIVLAWSFSLYAQERDESPVVAPGYVSQDAPKPKLADKVNVNLSAGTMFMYSKSFGNGSATYVAPEISYALTPRLRVNAGIMFLNSNVLYNRYYGMNEQSVVIRTKPAANALAYLSANYLLSDRLSVTGTVMRDMNSMNYGNYNPSIQAMSLHLDYKLSDNISVGAGVQMRQGSNWGYPVSGFGGYNPGFNPLYPY